MKKTFDIVSGAITLLVPILVEKICSPFLEKNCSIHLGLEYMYRKLALSENC